MKTASLFSLCLFLLLGGLGCRRIDMPRGKPDTVRMVVTGYCACKKCTSWKRNWLFQPVYAYGPNKGKPKEVGITSNGSQAQIGTAAADTRILPFGTVLRIPGYGLAEVHDRGGDIKGYHIDLFFKSHKNAKKWGKQILDVDVWRSS